jgi:tripartite-type tricarboxylate transporter receptor subunit TctC
MVDFNDINKLHVNPALTGIAIPDVTQDRRPFRPLMGRGENMRPTLSGILGAIIGLSVIAAGNPASAADFYKGKTITIIVPTNPGGTYDRMGRLLAKHMPNHIPGKPAAIVQNRPGGAYLIGARAVYKAKADGLMLMHFPTSAAFNQLLGKGGDVDFGKFEWLGSAGGARYMIGVASKLGIKTMDDLKNTKTPVKIGVQTAGSPITATARMAKRMASLNLKLVGGYKGMSKIMLAAAQGEVDAVMTAGTFFLVNATARESLNSGKMVLVADLGGAITPGKLVARVNKLQKLRAGISKKFDRVVYDTYMGTFKVTRPLVTTPGVPADRVAMLRRAFDDTFKDPAFRAAVTKAGFPIAPTSGPDAEKLIRGLFTMPADVKKSLLTYLK